MKTFSLKPHEVGYLKLLYSTFAGIDYATASAATQMKSRSDEKKVKVIREIQAHAVVGLASEYIRAALVMDNLVENDPTLICTFDPSDDNTEGVVNVYTKDEVRSANIAWKEETN